MWRVLKLNWGLFISFISYDEVVTRMAPCTNIEVESMQVDQGTRAWIDRNAQVSLVDQKASGSESRSPIW